MNVLNKEEFMSKVVNDLYKKKFEAKRKLICADSYAIENCNKTRNFRRN